MACIPGLDNDCNPLADLVVASVAKVLDDIARALSETAVWAVKTLVTGWLMVPSPFDAAVADDLRVYTYWAVAALAVGSLLFAATRMALERTGKSASDAALGMLKLILVTALATPITVILTQVGDSYATWIINISTGDKLGERILMFAPATQLTGLTSIATGMIAFMCIVVSMLQMLISIAVGGLKVLLCGLAPVPAAATIAGGGRATLGRYLSWLTAALLYKPVAATIYATAFFMLGKTGASITTIMTGLVVIAMAIVAMPALVRLTSPISAQIAGVSGGSVAAAGASGAGKVATGAVRLAAAHGNAGGGQGAGPVAPVGGAGGAATPRRPPAPIGPGGGGSAPTGPGPAGPGGAGPRTSGPNAGGGGVTGAGAAPAAGGGGAAGAGAAGGGAAGASGGAAAGGAAGGAAAAAGPAGAAAAAGAAVAQAGPAAVRKVGGLASGAAGGSEQQ